jgi:hypothetical protein
MLSGTNAPELQRAAKEKQASRRRARIEHGAVRTAHREDEIMGVAEEIRSYLGSLGANVGGKGQNGDAKLVIAEQKSFLSKKKVEYSAKFKVQDEDRVVRFFEMLKESGSGMSGSDASDVGGGWGFSKETYKTGAGGREGSIEAQGSLLGNKYAFTFNYAEIRTAIQAIAERNGYRFEYQITPKGL